MWSSPAEGSENISEEGGVVTVSGNYHCDECYVSSDQEDMLDCKADSFSFNYTKTYSQEFTAQDVISFMQGVHEERRCGNLNDLDWNKRMEYTPSCPDNFCATLSGGRNSAKYRIRHSSPFAQIRNLQYCYKITTQKDAVYNLTMTEFFSPPATNNVDIPHRKYTAFFKGDGKTMYVGNLETRANISASQFVNPEEIYWENNLINDFYIEYPDKALAQSYGYPYNEEDAFKSEIWLRRTSLAIMVPDYNHDLEITVDEKNKALVNPEPFNFWINDDAEIAEDEGDDQPGASSADSQDTQINTRRDFVDFFPVGINTRGLFEYFQTPLYTYKIQHASGALNIVESDSYNDSTWPGSGGEHLLNKEVKHLTGIGTGIELSHDFITLSHVNGAILLVEAKASTTEPLVLNIVDQNDQIVYAQSMSLNITNVESMYQHINLRGDGQGRATDADIENPPNGMVEDKHFVFVHGYNVSPEAARGWNAEIFKRMYWSGSHATFHGVTWEGNISQWKHDWPVLGQKTPNYHANVVNALKEAHKLADYINDLKAGGAEVVVAAHSLGNMLVSEAITRHGAQVDKYFMANAAVAAECYDPTTNSLDMVHSAWGDPNNGGFDERLYSAEWHELFDDTDGRNALTWNNFFGDMLGQTTVYNYYSKGEDVLGKHDHDDNPGDWEPIRSIFSGDQAWALQEKLKGSFWAGLTGETHGGWGFNSDYQSGGVLNPDTGKYIIAPTPALATPARVTDDMLRRIPFYKPGGTELSDLYETDLGNVYAQTNQHFLLATFIPALSLPAGANDVKEITQNGGENINMNASFQSGWPESRGDPSDPENLYWKHSDLKDVAYPYVHLLFDHWADEGGLR